MMQIWQVHWLEFLKKTFGAFFVVELPKSSNTNIMFASELCASVFACILIIMLSDDPNGQILYWGKSALH